MRHTRPQRRLGEERGSVPKRANPSYRTDQDGMGRREGTLTDFVVRDLEEDELSRSKRIEETQGHRSHHRTEKAKRWN
jgi:hypothetical protein